MKKKKPKFIYALMCGGHFDINALFTTKRGAEREAKYQYHTKCHKQIVALRLH